MMRPANFQILGYEMAHNGDVLERIESRGNVTARVYHKDSEFYLDAVFSYMIQEQEKLTTHEENNGENID